MLEEMIRINLVRGGVPCKKYRNNGSGCEIDIVTDDALIEVKRSDKVVDSQAKWLVSKEIQAVRDYRGKERIVLTNSDNDVSKSICERDLAIDKIKSLQESGKHVSDVRLRKANEASQESIEVHWKNISRYLIENTYKTGITSFKKLW